MMESLHFGIQIRRKIIVTLLLVRGGGGLLKLAIMARKANVLKYIWSFSENLENCKILSL